MSSWHERILEQTLKGENKCPLIMYNRKNRNKDRSDNEKHAIETIMFA